MKNLLRISVILILVSTLSFAMIPRVVEIPMPEDSLNNGGIGAIIGGVDVDGDGAPEIYVVNNNWNDNPSELIPRIYKLEKEAGGTAWNVVWSSSVEFFISAQNTWPALTLGDLDADGKMELIWGVVNNTAAGANPYRILVYEHAGGDNFGIDAGSGNWEPTAMWTITDTDNENIRPNKFVIVDIDDDGVDEICFDDRKGTTNGYFFGVASVDNIPDDGDGSETWTLEISGKDFTLAAGEENKWDVFIVNSKIYASCENYISQVYYDGTAWNYNALKPLGAGASFRSAQVQDIDEDGNEDVVIAAYFWGTEDVYFQVGVDDGDSLIYYNLFNIDTVTHLLNGGRICGGAQGDLDNDGKPDFVFGSRYSGPPNAQIYRLEHQGGDITESLNWIMTVVDTATTAFAPGTSGFWDIIAVGQTDGDPEDEIIYSSSISKQLTDGSWVSFPIIILDDAETVGIRGILTPRSFELGQAYPNPFNPTTLIPFVLNESGYVSLRVYDIHGGCVATLINGNMDIGTYEINFDASELSSGIYLYQLQLDNTFRAGKIVLNK